MLSVHSTSLTQSIRRSLSSNTQALSISQERLASGKRINRAADDAAGMQISTRLTSAIRSTNKVLEAIDNGINFGKIAMGGLDETMNSLQRMRTLAVQAQNGINSGQDLAVLNAEYQQLLNSVDDTAFNTSAFGHLPLVGDDELEKLGEINSISGTFENGITKTLRSGVRPIAFLPAGSKNIEILMDSYSQNDDLHIFNSAGQHLVGSPLTAETWTRAKVSTAQANDIDSTLETAIDWPDWPSENSITTSDIEEVVFTAENGFKDSATYDDSLRLESGELVFSDMTFTYSGDQHPSTFEETLVIDEVTENLLIVVAGEGSFEITATWDSIGNSKSSGTSFPTGDIKVTTFSAPGAANEHLVFKKTPATAESLFLSLTNVETVESAQAAIERLDGAIAQVGEYQSYYGASINRLSSAAANNQVRVTELSNANSRIEDADYAAETAIATAAQITRDSANAILAQANSRPEMILTLLG